MEWVLGTTVPVFVGVTVVLGGGAAFQIGQAVAGSWQPWHYNVGYACLLAVATQFASYALFDGSFIPASIVSSQAPPLGTALAGYLANVMVLVGVALVSYRLTLARRMVAQYPWLYARAGIFGWRAKI